MRLKMESHNVDQNKLGSKSFTKISYKQMSMLRVSRGNTDAVAISEPVHAGVREA